MARISVDNKPPPIVVYEQEPRIGFNIVTDSKLDKAMFSDLRSLDQVLDKAIFAPLRENTEFCFIEPEVLCLTVSPAHHSAVLHRELVQSSLESGQLRFEGHPHDSAEGGSGGSPKGPSNGYATRGC